MYILLYFAALLTLVCLVLEMKRDLMMLQQNSYRTERYVRWLKTSADTTSGTRLCGMVLFALCLSKFGYSIGVLPLVAVFSAVTAWRLFRAKYKKPVVFTARATRIFVVQCILAAALIAAAALLFGKGDWTGAIYAVTVSALGCYCGSHIIAMAAVWLLTPVDKAINRRYYNDAARILADMPDLRIIGITGSYGKTSTKHYLHRILSEHFDTLMTPGSFNTTLGVVRTVREYLKPYHQVFIVEMGAKQTGDIREICDLVHPTYGIITAVGPQHLESFKTIENVQATKFELADALPADGVAVLNNDFALIADRPVTNTRVIRYGVSPEGEPSACDWIAEDITYSADGTDFTAVRRSDGLRLALHTRLVGECNISNLLGAVAMAKILGVPDEKIRYGVARIEQVEHRLNVRRTPGGITIIDDAFNSNPVGSRMALDVLGAMKGGRRFLFMG